MGTFTLIPVLSVNLVILKVGEEFGGLWDRRCASKALPVREKKRRRAVCLRRNSGEPGETMSRQ